MLLYEMLDESIEEELLNEDEGDIRLIGAGGRERLYCFPLFAHGQLITTSVTSHSNRSKLSLATPRQNALRMSTNLSFRLKRISGYVLKSNVNRIKSRTAKFENKKSKLACEGRSEISLVAKLILRLIYKRLHPRVSCLHPQRKMRKFRARWRSARANFFHAVLLVVLVLLCDSVALKCGKANQTSRKCAGKIYFLSKELARAAELQEGSAICRVHWDEIRRSNNRCSVLGT